MTDKHLWSCGKCKNCDSKNLTVIDGGGVGCVDCGAVHVPGYRCGCAECRIMRRPNPAAVKVPSYGGA